ncbi:hypothetical protein VHEMI03209 [[Torrubiella] hemipterigena]|uniref:SUR7 protein n=1 Tax=[Torrubiella] hemipterigena TaxID=1531966 RepID=A0A0A1SS05_9HYPO|nr:hypothetical protein VHEMI03209 [[Torrubiella] hemipterigena]
MNGSQLFKAALPLLLIVCSTILVLFTTLSGVSHNELWLVRVDLTKLSFEPSTTSTSNPIPGSITPGGPKANLTANDLNLSNTYEINVWGYCYVGNDGQRQCTKAQYDWASSWLNVDNAGQLDSTSGGKIMLSQKFKDSLSLFCNITKGAQVALIFGLLVLGITFLVGVFARSVSTWQSIVAAIMVVFVCAAAGLVSAMSAIIMDVIENDLKNYGVVGSNGTTFLAIAWIGVVLALIAAIFWWATTCCCSSRGRSSEKQFD